VLELATNRYQSGVVSYLEVLEAQREVFDAEMALLELSRERIMGDLDLYMALGGGFPGEDPTLGDGGGQPERSERAPTGSGASAASPGAATSGAAGPGPSK
jgi:hypothetical protein